MTKDFIYTVSDVDANSNSTWGFVQYQKEDVCLCYTQGGKIVLAQDHNAAGCVEKGPSFDYAKLLNIPDVGYDGCACC